MRGARRIWRSDGDRGRCGVRCARGLRAGCVRRAPVAPRRRAASRVRDRGTQQPSRRDLGRRAAVGRTGRRGAGRTAAAADARLRRAPRRHRGRGRRADGRGRRRAQGGGPRRPAGHRNGRSARRLATSPSGRWRLSTLRPFRAATIDWTYSAAGEPDDAPFHSALVAPLATSAGVPGTLVAYSTAANAFRPEHATVLNDLLAEVATGSPMPVGSRTSRRGSSSIPRPASTNRRGYEVELGREVARASRTGRPLSVVLVGISNGSDTASTASPPKSADQFARLLTRVTRRSDISCRRGEHEFAILLPETRESGATVLVNRLREEARRALGADQTSIAVGRVEWQPDESAEALEARVEASLSAPSATRTTGFPPPRSRSDSSSYDGRRTPQSRPTRSRLRRPAARRPRGGCARDPGRAPVRPHAGRRRPRRRRARGALGADRESADAALGKVAKRLSESVGSGTVLRLSSSEFVLVLSGATADDAEALLGSLHGPGDLDELAGIELTAGITELVERDGAQTALGRAEHALWQARQAGPGSVVVAVPGRRIHVGPRSATGRVSIVQFGQYSAIGVPRSRLHPPIA